MTKLILPLLLILCVPLIGAEKELPKDSKSLKALAGKGDARAQFVLGVMYRQGIGVLQDDKEAVNWYRKAADQGHTTAQNNLGMMFDKGDGVLEDDVTAYAWYNIAAAKGSKAAKGNKPRVAKEMTAEQIAKAQELSKEMIKKNPKLIQKKD